MLFAVHVNLDDFVRDLMEGDPFVWALVVMMVIGAAVGLYQKFQAMKSESALGATPPEGNSPAQGPEYGNFPPQQPQQ